MEKLLDVPPDSFRPSPKVDSAIVRLIPESRDRIVVNDEVIFGEVVKSAFGQRRKTLRNTLRAYFLEEDFEALGIDAQLRAENLSWLMFAQIANTISSKRDQK